jgi:hypothetical protein
MADSRLGQLSRAENPPKSILSARDGSSPSGQYRFVASSLTSFVPTEIASSKTLNAASNRYVKLYAQGLVDDEELDGHLADLKNQVENLKMLVAAVEVDLAAKDERALVARTTEAWLLTLRENLADVEQDIEKAFGARRELATLLVEGITVSRGDDGRPRVEITYRFGPPEFGPGQAAGKSALGVQDSEEFTRAHARGGTQGLLRGHPKMTSYEVAVQRAGSGGE